MVPKAPRWTVIRFDLASIAVTYISSSSTRMYVSSNPFSESTMNSVVDVVVSLNSMVAGDVGKRRGSSGVVMLTNPTGWT